ncbi:MAG TPA: glycosyltransferase family 2 protein [Terriglobales bacterium]
MSRPELSIIIVNWNSTEYLRACLTSIFSAQGDVNLEVLVVDNGSYDSCGEMLRQHFPQARFLQSPKNLGFAGASNLAFAFSAGRNLLFLNPDTEVVGEGLQRMLDVLAGTTDAGIVGPRLVASDYRTQWNCMRRVPTILNQLLDASFTRGMFPSWWGLDVVRRESQEPLAAEVVPGTCLMVRRNVFLESGRFNPAYFMYAEDVDLCCRARNLGWKSYYLHDAVVIHHGARSSRLQSDDAFSAVLMRESVWKFLRASRGRAYCAVYGATTALAAACRLLACGGLWLTGSHERRLLWRTAARKWTRVLRWSLGLEGWTRTLGASHPPVDLAFKVHSEIATEEKLRA